jgi:predicted nucleotidyltransferase component of viral defense system
MQEQFELEVLDRLNSKRFLKDLVLGGGTMLRLCHGLNRFSVDLDFWIVKKIDKARLFKNIREYLGEFYTIKDAFNKFHTILFEIKSANYPRSLKIEIRKEKKKIRTEIAIAYSPHSNLQVIVRTVSLNDMMREKIDAFLERKEIRDIFDVEFLFKKGIDLNASPERLKNILKQIDSLTRKDYAVKLGSIIEGNQRKYYLKENFRVIKLAIREKGGLW